MGFPDSRWMEDPGETPLRRTLCCRSEGPRTNQKAHSVDVDLRAAAGFLTEGFLAEIAGAWSQWAWGMTEPVYKDTTY